MCDPIAQNVPNPNVHDVKPNEYASATTFERGPYDIPELEANFYYAGVGSNGRGPKLIFRTSDDVFEEPTGPWIRKRLMRVVPVPDSHDLGPNVTWDAIRDQVVVLLDEKIKFTSVDFVRFTWLNPESGVRHYTNPTIWIGILPGTLTGAAAHDSSKDIRAFLDSLDVQNIDIAYRESLYKPLASHGPPLFPPAGEDLGALKDVIDNVSVTLSISIAGFKMTMEGTLGPYFRVGNKLYAITVRHNLFSVNESNSEYRYHNSAPKKEVVVMSPSTFEHYLASIQALISILIDTVSALELKITTFRARVQDGINVVEMQGELGKWETELAKTRIKIEELENFLANIKKESTLTLLWIT